MIVNGKRALAYIVQVDEVKPLDTTELSMLELMVGGVSLEKMR